MSHSLPTTTGFSSTIENIGAIENKGLEFALNANLVRAKDFEWNFAATLSMDKNKVTRLYGDNDVVYNVDSDRNIQKKVIYSLVSLVTQFIFGKQVELPKKLIWIV